MPNCNNNSYSHADVVVEMINKDMHLQAIHIILSSHFNFRMLYSPVESTLARIMEKLDHDMKYESDHDRNYVPQNFLVLLRGLHC